MLKRNLDQACLFTPLASKYQCLSSQYKTTFSKPDRSAFESQKKKLLQSSMFNNNTDAFQQQVTNTIIF